MSEGVDSEARRQVAEVRHELRNYCSISDIKHDNLKKEVDGSAVSVNKALEEIKSLMKWAGSLIISLIIGVLGWSLVQQYQANEQQKRELEQQIRLLQEQERTRAIAEANRQDIQDLAPSGGETPLPTRR